MLALAGALASAGLNLLADVIKQKGKGFVEKKFGVKIPDNPGELQNPELLVKLKELELKHEEELQKILLEEKEKELTYLATIDRETTRRWLSDNAAGTVTKLVRPFTLVYLLLAYTILAILDQNLIQVKDLYITTLSELLKIAVIGYFSLRSIEKLRGVEK
ncbi:hypothetical protein [Phorcysia thermohydrogeniphila]|uniref:Uncharacterized protein n=1 Tax=Phorcysia thermohydrogeniphila TaxID=936138 RepID=A0A4R1GHU4_9BACT|nr:hypothetical protein [Phorcysia thermohydrogeniphila]TCK06355.1 hypothetical protein CLV27_0156 [Phorcysia thermohydrogeniphila]